MKKISIILALALCAGCDYDPCDGYRTCDDWQSAVMRDARSLEEKRSAELDVLQKKDWPAAGERQMLNETERAVLYQFPSLSCKDAQGLIYK